MRKKYHTALQGIGHWQWCAIGAAWLAAFSADPLCLRQASVSRSLGPAAGGPALVLKHFAPLLAPARSLDAKLAARVGSIGDNRKSGWYGYRASKAAMNMLLQTAALELQRKQPQLVLVALQPGTMNSRLSAPFQANVEHLLEPEQSVAGMR